MLYNVIYLTNVYLRVVSRGTCYCPSRLDFHPIPSSSERFADQQRCDPPPIFQRASIWPGIDRGASGLPPMTPSEHASLTVNCCGLVGFPSASGINPLTSPLIKTPWHFSKRTTGRCSYHRFHAQSACTQLVSRSFHIRQGYFSAFLRVTCKLSVSSCFRIGSICLPHSPRFPTHATL